MKFQQILVSSLLLLYVIDESNGFDAKGYLKKFGYYHDNGFAAENTKMSQAIADFQRTFNLPVTGKLDDGTTTLMKTPRCGVTGHQNQGYSFAKWNQFHLLYNYDNYTPDLGKAETKRLTERAFKYWADVTPLKFTEHRGFGNILIYFGRRKHRDGRGPCDGVFDGLGGELAHAFSPPDGRLHFDEDERFTSNSTSGINYLWTATHEIGHILGLDHDNEHRDAVMYPIYKRYNPKKGMELHDNDIKRIQALYGKKGKPLLPKCEDTIVNCESLKSYCDGESQSWKNLMERKCRLTCGFCKPKL